MVNIIKGSLDRLDEIMEVYKIAREFMRKTNNPNQWGDNHPPRDLIKKHILEGNLYIGINQSNEILFSFALIFGEDPTYKVIENGKWIDDSNYGTIHSLASAQKIDYVFDYILAFSLTKIDHIRIDTHEDNKVFQHILEKHNFKKCGVIYLLDGSPRLAYELIV